MEYTVQKLAKLAGVSGRTLRYYDEIGLLRPGRINSSGYRLYGAAQLDRLQQILFYRELGLALEEIGSILDDPSFDRLEALAAHRAALLEQRSRLDRLVCTVENSILAMKGEYQMSDKEKFRGFQEQKIKENREEYGPELEAAYGREAVKGAEEKFLGMSREEYLLAQEEEKEILKLLEAAWKTGDPAGEAAGRLGALHQKWLRHYWADYSPQAHMGLAELYVADDRFARYYDAHKEGKAEFLRDALVHYLKHSAKG